MRTTSWVMAGLVVAIGAAGLFAWSASAVETPEYNVEIIDGAFELRRYPTQVVATVTRDGDRSRAVSDSFRPLANYIFAKSRGGEKIAMTAPVTETLAGDGPVMSFTMPSAYAMDELPAPLDPDVTLHEIPERTVAAVSFSGWATGGKIKRHTRELLATLEDRGIELAGDPSLNQYNPPWTPPFMRRNEIIVEVRLN